MKPHEEAICLSGRRERAVVEAIAAIAPEPLYWTARDISAATGAPLALAEASVMDSWSTWDGERLLPGEGIAICEAIRKGHDTSARIRLATWHSWAEPRGYRHDR